MPSRRSILLGLLAGVLSAAGFSLKAVLAKLAYQDPVDATTVLALRMLYSLPFYLALFTYASRSSAPLTRATAWRTAGVGVLGYFFASYFDFLGLENISAGLERLVLYLYPTLVLVLGRVLFGRPILVRDVVGAAVAYAGLAVALSGEVSLGRPPATLALGVGLVMLSALTYAGYVLGSGQLVAEVGSLRFTSLAMLAATVPMLTLFALRGGVARLPAVPARVHVIAMVMAVFATVVPSLLMTEGIKRLGSSRAALVGSIGPLMTLGLEASWLGEPVTGRTLIGMAAVIGGVLYATLPRAPATAPAPAGAGPATNVAESPVAEEAT